MAHNAPINSAEAKTMRNLN